MTRVANAKVQGSYQNPGLIAGRNDDDNVEGSGFVSPLPVDESSKFRYFF